MWGQGLKALPASCLAGLFCSAARSSEKINPTHLETNAEHKSTDADVLEQSEIHSSLQRITVQGLLAGHISIFLEAPVSLLAWGASMFSVTLDQLWSELAPVASRILTTLTWVFAALFMTAGIWNSPGIQTEGRGLGVSFQRHPTITGGHEEQRAQSTPI